jgi:hypothetical protein
MECPKSRSGLLGIARFPQPPAPGQFEEYRNEDEARQKGWWIDNGFYRYRNHQVLTIPGPLAWQSKTESFNFEAATNKGIFGGGGGDSLILQTYTTPNQQPIAYHEVHTDSESRNDVTWRMEDPQSLVLSGGRYPGFTERAWYRGRVTIYYRDPSAAALSDPGNPRWLLGQQVAGAFETQRGPLTLVAVGFQGDFNLASINAAFQKALEYNERSGQTAAPSAAVQNGDPSCNQTAPLAPDRHAVLGWCNLQTRQYQFIGFQLLSDTTYRYIRANGQVEPVEGQLSDFTPLRFWESGLSINMPFADDDRGGIVWPFDISAEPRFLLGE